MLALCTAALALAPTSRSVRAPGPVVGRPGPAAPFSRRELGVFGAAALAAIPNLAQAFDSIPTVDPDLEAIEKKRKEREAVIAKNKIAIKPYLEEISRATNAKEFSDATDKLAAYVIGEGRIPEGIEPTRLRDNIVDSYKSLPMTVSYKVGQVPPPGLAPCELTRDNGGVCYSPGGLAEESYRTVINELRTYAKSKGGVGFGKGKGALISDGVSAANSAAF